LCQLLLNGLPYVPQVCPWIKKLDVCTLWIRHKFGEVPGDLLVTPIASIMERAIAAQVAPDFVCIRAINLTFGEHGERGVVTLSCELLYLCVRAGFLPSKLIAGEGKDLETLLSILLVEICQLSVVVGRHASLRCHVHKHDNLFL